MLFLAAACGAGDEVTKEEAGSPKLEFAKDIAPIIKESCSDTACHGKATPGSVVYEDDEAAFKASKSAKIPIGPRLAMASTDDDYMPRGKVLDAAKKQKLLDFLIQ